MKTVTEQFIDRKNNPRQKPIADFVGETKNTISSNQSLYLNKYYSKKSFLGEIF